MAVDIVVVETVTQEYVLAVVDEQQALEVGVPGPQGVPGDPSIYKNFAVAMSIALG